MNYILKNLFRFLFFALILCSIDAQAANPKTGGAKKTICLNMIVKDESKVIQRCLESVKKVIDYWVIVDTGSTDGTQKIIKDFMKNIPGELHERPWVNFGHNRNEALQLAKNKGDYLLFIDADEYLIFSEGFVFPNLDKDLYYANVQDEGARTARMLLLNNRLDWQWKGVIHEYPVSSQAKTSDLLSGVINFTTADGCRSQDPKKYFKDAEVLEKTLLNEPENSRYVFYLAQTYEVIKQYSLALKNFEKRVSMGGSAEEIFWSLYHIAKLQETVNMPSQTVINSYCAAFIYRPSRVEPVFHLGRYLILIDKFDLAQIVLNFASTFNSSSDKLFVETWIFDYGLKLEMANCNYWLGNYKSAMTMYMELLANKHLPIDTIKFITNNIECTKAKLK